MISGPEGVLYMLWIIMGNIIKNISNIRYHREIECCVMNILHGGVIDQKQH